MGAAAPAHLPLTVSWNLTRRCNLACAHCYIDATGKDHGTDELGREECFRVLGELAALSPQAFLILTGGEPLLRKDIYDLIRESTSLGFWTVLGSHGGLMDRPVAQRLVESGLKGIGISLDSLEPEKHNRFRGIPKAWENTVAAIDVMRDEGLPFLIEMTLTRSNRTELDAMADFAASKGATALNAFFLVPTGRGAQINDLSPAEYEELFGALAGLQERHAGTLLVNAKCAPHYRRVLWERNHDSPYVRTFRGGGCPAGTYYCRIGPTGDVTPCPYMPLAVGNVRRSPLADIWNESEVLNRLRHDRLGGRCGECEFTELCGGCRCRAYATSGDYLAEDPSCTYEPGRYGGMDIPLPPERTYGSSTTADPATMNWTPEAEDRLRNVPFFARGIVRRAVEQAASERGLSVITAQLMTELRERMSSRFPIRKST